MIQSVLTELRSAQAHDRRAFFLFARQESLDIVIDAIESIRGNGEFVGELMMNHWPEILSEAIEAAEAHGFT